MGPSFPSILMLGKLPCCDKVTGHIKVVNGNLGKFEKRPALSSGEQENVL
jgi:hypothetical protein